jgi:hypothetical protein
MYWPASPANSLDRAAVVGGAVREISNNVWDAAWGPEAWAADW